MTRFEPSALWLKSVLPEEYASVIKDTWCWPQISQYYHTHDIPRDISEPIAQVIIDVGKARFCYYYCYWIEDREDMVDVIRDSGEAWAMFYYCVNIKNRKDLADALKDTEDVEWCGRYCRKIQYREDMQAISDRVTKDRELKKGAGYEKIGPD